MIRRAEERDWSGVAQLWLEANIDAHDFIPAQYWEANFEAVKDMLPQAEVLVWEGEDGIQGFVGLNGDCIEGIFVRSGSRSGGIGRELLDRARQGREQLALQVYKKNARAVSFYLREGFQVQREQLDDNTGETEYLMLWRR